VVEMSEKILLDIQNITVEVEGKKIIQHLSLTLPRGESYVLFGPNGSGKSTLINAVIGISNYQVTEGKIIFDGKEITHLPIDERIKMGISMTFQQPPEIKGIKLMDLFKFCLKRKINEDLDPIHYDLIERFKLTSFLDRNINVGFSGGERKRSEVIQMLFLKPKLLLLDEIDSGVDIESLRLISKEIQNYIKNTGTSALIVTHQGEILEHIATERACVLLNSTISCYKNSQDIYRTIKEVGFAKCIECQDRVVEQSE
jgi:Fe-S cluster assembly ATP-binding protein